MSDNTRALNRLKENDLRDMLNGGLLGEVLMRSLMGKDQEQVDRLYALVKDHGIPPGMWYSN
jgi:hypothetical protein